MDRLRKIRIVVCIVTLLVAGMGGATGASATGPTNADALKAAPYRQIISLYGAHTENLLAMGAGPQLIGIDRQSTGLPGAAGKPVFSYHDDPERFLAARPDLVLIRPMIARGYPRLVERLVRSDIRVVSLQPTTVEALAGYWQTLGELCGQADAAAHMTRTFDTAVAAFKALSATVTTPKRVYFEAIHSKMKTFTPQAMAAFALETAGGINVATDAPVRANNNIAIYGKERLLSHAADIDVFLSQQGAMNRITREAIMAEPGFGVIKAVKTHQVFLVDETVVSRPTLRLIEGIYRIGSLLYPEVYTEAGRRILADAGLPEGIPSRSGCKGGSY
ncbi:ABC transporter substrate-binding protein [Desulfosarcina ovata subsp. sediminis]|uniref:ABC transporter substrate-binding protein n=1 Tax=Desulfosarcina ovata subsp. sediminis TaxID=885957 RepID=A0A5K7ZP43_9BACT|nr:ABC transporter substrate-binding protein [Desulfosarcina ovata]BBO82505.1 ABC transporter substrate-binding protein [Desulfosarcina ovata subsp. sediminis]